jgi:hypothetical protein
MPFKLTATYDDPRPMTGTTKVNPDPSNSTADLSIWLRFVSHTMKSTE